MRKLSSKVVKEVAEFIEASLAEKVRGKVPLVRGNAKPERNKQIVADAVAEVARKRRGALSAVARKHKLSRARVVEILKQEKRGDLLVQPEASRLWRAKTYRDKVEERCRLAIVLRVEYKMSWYHTAELLGLYTRVKRKGGDVQVVDTMRLVKSVRRYCRRNKLDDKLLFHVPLKEKGMKATTAWQAYVKSTGLLIEDFGIDRDNLTLPSHLMEKLNGNA